MLLVLEELNEEKFFPFSVNLQMHIDMQLASLISFPVFPICIN